MDAFQLIEWDRETDPQENDLREILSKEGLQPYRWSNRPGDVYAAHDHPFHKIIYVVRGSIVFVLPDRDKRIEMNAGDRLELPAGITHQAYVGPQGVVCLEAHK